MAQLGGHGGGASPIGNTASDNARKRKRGPDTAGLRHRNRVKGWLALLDSHPALVLPMLATGTKGGGACTAKGAFATGDLPTLKSALTALDAESLSWLRGNIDGLDVRQAARGAIERWVAGLERGFQAVVGEVTEDGDEDEDGGRGDEEKRSKRTKHVVVWALRDVDEDGRSCESLTPTTAIRFNFKDEQLLSEPWAQSWPSEYKRLCAHMPKFLKPARPKAKTYTVSQSLMCGVLAQSSMRELKSLQDVVFTIDPLSLILERIAARRWLASLRELARGGQGEGGAGGVGDVELGRVLVVLADPHLVSRREVSHIMAKFGDLANTMRAPTSLRTYPGPIEMESEQAKFGDLRALDAIASQEGCGWPWRPRTCPGTGHCPLGGVEETVYKRSWSSRAEHFYKGPRSRVGRLVQCTTATPAVPHDQPRGESAWEEDGELSPSVSRMAAMDPGAYWFHQEYVQELAESEFRVFIVCTLERQGEGGASTTTASRTRRRGRVVKVLSTTAPTAPAGLLAPEAQSYHFSRRCITQEELERFALDAYERLRKLGGGAFESLEVGVRLDVGVRVRDGRGCPFVNEVTRWYCADQFADAHGAAQGDLSQLHLARSFASAFVEWIDSAL